MSINSNLCQFGFLSSSVKFSFESFEEISNNLEVLECRSVCVEIVWKELNDIEFGNDTNKK